MSSGVRVSTWDKQRIVSCEAHKEYIPTTRQDAFITTNFMILIKAGVVNDKPTILINTWGEPRHDHHYDDIIETRGQMKFRDLSAKWYFLKRTQV